MGVVAAIAVPRLGLAAERAAYGTLRSNEHAFQLAVDLYAAEHQGRNPAQNSDRSPLNNEGVFLARLLGRSDIDGVPRAAGLFGPYLRRLPVNPYSTCGGVRFDGAPPGQDCAWRIDSASGLVKSDHSNTQANRHETYPRHASPGPTSTPSPTTNLEPAPDGTAELGTGGKQGGNNAVASPLLIPD